MWSLRLYVTPALGAVIGQGGSIEMAVSCFGLQGAAAAAVALVEGAAADAVGGVALSFSSACVSSLSEWSVCTVAASASIWHFRDSQAMPALPAALGRPTCRGGACPEDCPGRRGVGRMGFCSVSAPNGVLRSACDFPLAAARSRNHRQGTSEGPARDVSRLATVGWRCQRSCQAQRIPTMLTARICSVFSAVSVTRTQPGLS